MKRIVVITNEISLQSAIGAMRAEFKAQNYLRVTLSTDKPRSLPQNNLIYAMYEQISREGGQEDVKEVRRRCKLHYGVPILRAEDEEYRAKYDLVIKPLAYEIKLEAMDVWPVSSVMSTDQLSRYAAEIERKEIPEARAVA